MYFLSNESADKNLKDKVYVVLRRNRKIRRKDASGRYEDAPDTPKGEEGELKVARDIAKDIPCLILLRQNGLIEHDWKGEAFWWPVLVVQQNITPIIFASEVEK